MVRPTPGTIISSIVHAAVLAWIVFGFSFNKLDAAPSEPLPVDVISAAQFDHLTKGERHAKPAKEAKVKAEKVAPAKPAPKPEVKIAKHDVTPPPPPPPPAEKVAPKPVKAPPPPEPVEKVEKKVEAKEPPPVPPALPVPAPKREIADAAPVEKPAPKKPEPKKPEPKKPEPKKPAPKKPEPRRHLDHREMAQLNDLIAAEDQRAPDHPKKTAHAPPQKNIAQFDPNKIAALIDHREPSRTASVAPRVSAASTAGIADGAEGELSLSEQSRIAQMVREQVERCWRPPAGAIGADDLQVMLQFSLNADGSLSGRPAVVNRSSAPYFQAAAESAQTAVYQCAPLHLPARDYAYWKDVQIKFDPRDMRGG